MTRFLVWLCAGAASAAIVVAGCSSTPDTAPPPQPSTSRSLPEVQQAPGAPVIAGYTVSIGKLGVRSSLIGLGLNQDRSIQVPALDQPGQLGLYRSGPRPGAVGPAVILGHVNGRINGAAIPGAFSKLDTLKNGDRIDVAVPDGLASRTISFKVYDRQIVEKEKFPRARVYGDRAGPELVLITCGGIFDRAERNYESNVIIYARMVS